jgi:hypothetical protein
MAPSGLLFRVALVRADASEVLMEALIFSETSVSEVGVKTCGYRGAV